MFDLEMVMLMLSVASTSSRSHKLSAVQHRQELEKLLMESEKRSTDSGYTEELGEEDEALEMLGEAGRLRHCVLDAGYLIAQK